MSLNSTLPWAATTVAMAKRPAGSINHSCNKLPQKKIHFSPVLVVTDCWSELIVRQVRYYTHEDSARPDYTKYHLDFGIWVRSQILGASLCEPCGLFSRQMCWLFNHFWSYSTYKWFITSFFSSRYTADNRLSQFDLLLFVLKASLSSNNKCVATTVLCDSSIDFNSCGRCNCCAAWPAFMSSHKITVRRWPGCFPCITIRIYKLPHYPPFHWLLLEH